MAKRTEYEIFEKLLLKVSEGEATYAKLARTVGTGTRTIKEKARILERLGQVAVRETTHPSNGRESYVVSITEHGRKSLGRMRPQDKRPSGS